MAAQALDIGQQSITCKPGFYLQDYECKRKCKCVLINCSLHRRVLDVHGLRLSVHKLHPRREVDGLQGLRLLMEGRPHLLGRCLQDLRGLSRVCGRPCHSWHPCDEWPGDFLDPQLPVGPSAKLRPFDWPP